MRWERRWCKTGWVKELCVTVLCMCKFVYVKVLCVCVKELYVTKLCTRLCVKELYVTKLCVKELCVKELCVTKLCVKELCVTKLCVKGLCDKVVCERNLWQSCVEEFCLPPEPVQCHKCHACHAKWRSMPPSATPAMQTAAATKVPKRAARASLVP